MDKDLRALLEEGRVSITVPDILRTPYTEETFILEHGFTPEYYPAYKALIGDRSDSVAGVLGIGPVGATEIILAEGGVESGLDNMSQADVQQYRHALQLVTLDPTAPDKIFKDYLKGRSCNVRQLRLAKKMYNQAYGDRLAEGTMNEFKKLLGLETMRDKVIAVNIDERTDNGPVNTEVFPYLRREKSHGAHLVLHTGCDHYILNELISFCVDDQGIAFDLVVSGDAAALEDACPHCDEVYIL
jgi:5'-3' exonuclease